jgi:general L-amino acid transport system ATP-binding protein
MAEEIIICRDVHKWFGDFHVLRGVTLTVRKGEVVVICGPSGSGKSTFIRTLNRLEEHQRGQIIIDGIELTHDVRNIEAIRREIGMVFQSFNLFPHLTVLQNITLAPIWVRKMKRSEAEDLWRCSCWRAWALLSKRTNTRRSFPGGSSSGWRSRGR